MSNIPALSEDEIRALEEDAQARGQSSLYVVNRADLLRLLQEVRALRTASQWQPIAEAPEEGAWAFVYAGGAVNCMFVRQGYLPDDWTCPQSPNILPEDVTHWMPSPLPPQTTNTMTDSYPRRSDILRMTPAELAIRKAVLEVEKLPGDVRLTDAVILLSQAQNKVADYVDSLPPATTPHE